MFSQITRQFIHFSHVVYCVSSNTPCSMNSVHWSRNQSDLQLCYQHLITVVIFIHRSIMQIYISYKSVVELVCIVTVLQFDIFYCLEAGAPFPPMGISSVCTGRGKSTNGQQTKTWFWQYSQEMVAIVANIPWTNLLYFVDMIRTFNWNLSDWLIDWLID